MTSHTFEPPATLQTSAKLRLRPHSHTTSPWQDQHMTNVMFEHLGCLVFPLLIMALPVSPGIQFNTLRHNDSNPRQKRKTKAPIPLGASRETEGVYLNKETTCLFLFVLRQSISGLHHSPSLLLLSSPTQGRRTSQYPTSSTGWNDPSVTLTRSVLNFRLGTLVLQLEFRNFWLRTLS